MKIELYIKDGLIEIKRVGYMNYSGKNTMVEYDYYNEEKTVTFDGWLSLEQICEKLVEKLKDSDD